MKELREMFPESPNVEIKHATNGMVVMVCAFAGALRVGTGFTLTEAMGRVREWRKANQ